MKFDKRKHYYGILDVESAGECDSPLVYDLALVIVDKKGVIHDKKNWVIQEIFDDLSLMEKAYFIRFYDRYLRMIRKGEVDKVPFDVAREEFNEMLVKWNVKTICAYNLAFDGKALPSTMIHLEKESNKFLTHPCKKLDLWSMFCETVGQQKGFRSFAIKNGYYSEYGNIRTSAEIAYRYITKNTSFIESHTALNDCIIESEIFAHCLKQHKKFTRNRLIDRPFTRVPKLTSKEKKEIELLGQ